MLKRFIVFFFLLIIIPAICHSQEALVNQNPMVLVSESVITQTKSGVLAGYFGVDDSNLNRFFVASTDEKGKISGQTAVSLPGLKPLHAKIAEANGNIILLLHSKAGTGQKYIHRFISRDNGATFQEPLQLNTATDVLAPINLNVSGRNVYASWIDERRQGRHDIYLNYSHDYGQSFQKADINITEGFSGAGAYSLLAEGTEVHVVFTGAGDNKPAGLYYRMSKDAGRSWTKAVMVAQYAPDWQPHDVQALRLQDGSVRVFWVGRGLHTAASGDGINWKQGAVIASNEEDYVWNFKAISNNKTVYIVMDMGNLQYNFMKIKPSVYIARSQDSGSTWSEPAEIRKYKHNSTSALQPAIAFSPDGQFAMTAWRDHRDIRGSIYANYSTDGGSTWQAQDIAIEDSPGKYNSHTPHIVMSGNDIYIIWLRARDDTRGQFDLYMKKINKDAFAKTTESR